MSQRRKSKPEHDLLVNDESADPIERAEAIFCLGLDRRKEFASDFERLVAHPEADVRGRALQALLTWGRSEYLPHALNAVCVDPDEFARGYIALGLTAYARVHPKARTDICRALTRALRTRPEDVVNAYRAILWVLEMPQQYHLDLNRYPNTDIDWDLLKPYDEPIETLN